MGGSSPVPAEIPGAQSPDVRRDMTSYVQDCHDKGGIPGWPALDGLCEADVAIVGGGYSGLSAAIELADRGYSVVLLEARTIGWGASGRNGGQICSGYGADMDKVEAWMGQDAARALWDIGEEAKALVADRIRRFDIDCGYGQGNFIATTRASQMPDLEEMAEHWENIYGYRGLKLVPRDRVEEHVRTRRYHGGLHDPGAAHLQPLEYCLGLARGASRLGVRIFEQSAVTGYSDASTTGGEERAVLKLEQGEVRAGTVVFCCNAYLGKLVPSIRSRIMPAGTWVMATDPMSPERARALLPRNDAVNDCRFVLDYYRLSTDHRLVFGGGVSYSTLAPRNLAATMRRTMLKVFPDLADVGIHSAWAGNVAITMERMPHLGRVPLESGKPARNLYFAQGFSGHGVALTGIAGRILAEAIAGQQERLDLFARIPVTPFPGGPVLRTPALILGGLWYRLRDIL